MLGKKNTKHPQLLSTAEGTGPANTIKELHDTDSTSDVSGGADASGRTDASDPDRLNTINEEQEEYLNGISAAGTPGSHDVPDILPARCDSDKWNTLEYQQQTFLQYIHKHDEMRIEETKLILLKAAPGNSLPNTTAKDDHAVYTTLGAELTLHGNPDVDENGNTYHKIELPDNTGKLITDTPPLPEHTAKQLVYEAMMRAIIERSNDTLTHDEPAKHKTSMPAGIHEELITWHSCYIRKLRQQARDIVDARWTGKWKSVITDSVV